MDYISQSSKEWCEVEGVIIFTPNVTFKSPLFKEENPGFASPFRSLHTLHVEFNWTQTVWKGKIISLFYQNETTWQVHRKCYRESVHGYCSPICPTVLHGKIEIAISWKQATPKENQLVVWTSFFYSIDSQGFQQTLECINLIFLN